MKNRIDLPDAIRSPSFRLGNDGVTFACVCVCVHACVHVCVCMCLCACVCVCAHDVLACTIRAWYVCTHACVCAHVSMHYTAINIVHTVNMHIIKH